MRSGLALLLGVLALLVLMSWSRPAAAASAEEPRALVKQGNALYQAGRFEDALRAYQRAYELRPRPVLLFNLAQCHRELGRLARAIYLYERYLVELPAAPDRAEVTALVAQLRARQRKREADRLAVRPPVAAGVELGAGAAARPATSADRPFYRRWYFWTPIALAVAGGAAAAAVVLSRSGPACPVSSWGGSACMTLHPPSTGP
jgi:tetratricopeptide (TPR) repeat protein